MTGASPAGIDLSDTAFWGWPLADRAAAFALLRAQPQPQFYAEPEVPFSEKGPGYSALVRYADVAEASRHPDVFCSGKGATNIVDLPAEFNEYFGSMINMDDPRHARLRRIVSRAFSPRLVAKTEQDVRPAAATIVDDLLGGAPRDFARVGPGPRRGPGLRVGNREHRRGAADRRRARLVFHPAGGGRQRDHPNRALARADAAHRVPRPARAAPCRPRSPA